MKIRFIFVALANLLANLLLISSLGCTLVHRRDIPVVEASGIKSMVSTAESTPDHKPSLKKIISDRDIKKEEDDKELKKRIAILPFVDKKAVWDAVILKNSHLAFMDSLNETGELIAIDSGALKLDLNKYIKDNMYDLKAIAKDSRNSGVSSILEGRIIDIRFKDEAPTTAALIATAATESSAASASKVATFEVVVQARLLNIQSGQELFNTVKTVTITDENSKIPEGITSENFFKRNSELTELLIKDAFLDFNTKLVDTLKLIVWEGRIAALHGEKIYLNVGQISGVKIGDILKVVDDGNEVYDTELGYPIGKVSGRVKGTLEIVGFFGQDGAISVIHSGAGFKENDRIEIYQ